MPKRLNVTEDERCCFSRRALSAILALRNAGLDTGAVTRGKDKLPGWRGRWYRLVTPDQEVIFFSRLADIVAYAEEFRLWQTTMALLERDERISWKRWRTDGTAYALALLVPQLRALARAEAQQATPRCDWPECHQMSAYAAGDGRYCAAHWHVVSATLGARTA